MNDLITLPLSQAEWSRGFFGGFLKFLVRERGVDQNFWGQEGGMPIFFQMPLKDLKVFVTLLINYYVHKWKSLFSSSGKDDFIINALNCNVFYFVQSQLYLQNHHLYFYPAFIHNITDCLHSRDLHHHCYHYHYHHHHHHHHHHYHQN